MLEAVAEAFPSTATLAVVVLAFLAGSTVPTYYAQERLRGFGRAVADRFPYRPPAGMEEAEAMQAATEHAAEQQAEADETEEAEDG
jgi:hypothetical protein